MAATKLIKQGESLPFCFDRSGETVTGWICTIVVKQFPSDTPLINRIIPPNGDTWQGYLTSDETAALAVSSKTPYYLIGGLVKTITNEETQIPIRFHVAETWT